MKYFFIAFRKWNDINGRANLSEFWYFILFQTILYFLIYFIDGYIGIEYLDYSGYEWGVVEIFYSIIAFIPNITITVRRLHDVNKSGWNLLWYITIIGILYVLFLNILKGTNGDNYYGSPSTA